MMRNVSVVGLNAGQDEDEEDLQQLEGAGSGRVQASVSQDMWKTFICGKLMSVQVGRCSRGASKSRGNGRGSIRNQAQAGSQTGEVMA